MSIEGRDATVPAAVNQRKRLAFLALLAASEPHGIARERVLLLLWPESTAERARAALYQLLYVVRQAFGDDAVVGTDELRLDTDIVDSDVSRFNEAVGRGDLLTAVDLYSGPFLDAVHLSGAPELERWVEQKRQELARSYQSVLARLVKQAMERRDHTAAIAFAERLVDTDPLGERATVLLMEALAAGGDIAAALERARTHASIMRRELEADVGSSVSALATRLKAEAKVNASTVVLQAPSESIHAVEENAPAPTHPHARSRPRTVAVAVLSIAAIALALVAAMRRPRDRGTEFVVVADFATAPADSQIADMLTDVTRRALSASRSLGAAPDVRMVAARQRLHVPANARLSIPVARQIAIGDGIRSVVAGSLTSFAGSYAMSLRLLSASSGEVLATAEQAGIAPSQLFGALDTLTRRLRQQAGDDLQTIRTQPSLLALTSTSLEAMTAYVTALRLPRDSAAHAVALLREAVTLDTSFASALWQLSRLIELTGPVADSVHRDLLARAWRHRDGLTEYEQLRLEIAYKFSPDGTSPDRMEHVERLRRVVERYPNAADAKILGDFYVAFRDLPAAEQAYRLVSSLDSTRVDAYAGVANTYLKGNRISEARQAVDELARRFPDSPGTASFDVLVSYAEGRRDRARDIAHGMTVSTGPNRILGYIAAANLDLVEGRVAAWERGMRVADSLVGLQQRAPALRSSWLLTRFWILNRPDMALGGLDSSLASNPSLRSSLEAAELYAQFGQPDSARAMLALRGVTDRTVYLRGTDTLPVSAWIDLHEGRPRAAAARFRESLRFSGGSAPSQTSRDAETGLAFERAGLPDSAIAMYEHYLRGTPGLELDALRLVWVLERVARLYETKGDRRKAAPAYDRVADLWNNADTDLQPRVSYARQRATALR